MFDNLRDQTSYEFEDEVEDLLPQERAATPSPSRPFLGLTPQQRFILSALFFLTVCTVGGLLLLITGRFWVF